MQTNLTQAPDPIFCHRRHPGQARRPRFLAQSLTYLAVLTGRVPGARA